VSKLGDITLYAHWKNTSSVSTVSFNNAGSAGGTTKEVYPGACYGTLPEPSRTGYVFTGWYDDSKLTVPVSQFDISRMKLLRRWQSVG